ncbi:Zinc finger BED-type [Arabidopsis thaliana x Arabidopsis arenosa]|uniref:Zinc finger BED-type n=1 Tax=Arabidopsis thaliana x Arabidopsis arenosa TaxID=1240361 RepID=A0A8T1ZKL4_9BRAS|nr:Zinc finger BED-type [Arabidopsis thaliana x Arabidopsis arenosa]
MTEEQNESEPPLNPQKTGETETVTGNKRPRPASGADKPTKPRKKYAKRAPVWEHFIQREEDLSKSYCKYCKAEIACDTKTVGTSPMIGHINRCKQYKDWVESENQKILSSDNNGNMKLVKYDPVMFRRSVNEMVVVSKLPFSFVESEGWKRFCSNVLPMYKTFSRKTCSTDIVAMYLEEKAALKQLFSVEKQRVSLTTDIWTCPTTSYNYMVITGHWISTEWELQKRILSFKVITDHKGDTIAAQLMDCLDDWGSEKVYAVTVDNARNNDKALEVFKNQLRMRGVDSLVKDGEFLHMRCCAHILNLIVGHGLKKANAHIVAIRNAVKYVRSSFSRLKTFALKCETGKLPRGSLPLDVSTRWNSTYLMLSSALKLRVAFEKMEAEDKLYCDYFLEEEDKIKRVGPPTSIDWEKVARLVKFLKVFYKCTLIFSASKTVTSCLCYSEIVDIERSLITKCSSSDEETKKQANDMRDKFDKYWDGLSNMNPLVIVASVFDPRNKMKFASLCFDQLYGKDTIESRKLHASVSSVMETLYDHYSFKPTNSENNEDTEDQTEQTDSQPQPCTFELSDDEDDCEGMLSIYDKVVGLKINEVSYNELKVYLTEKPEPRVENQLGMPYDVLSWWRRNCSKFIVLSEFARDVLAIQASSVASESAFSTSGRVLDPYRSSLTPYMVEVLLCTQQWLKCTYKKEDAVANLAQMLQEFEFFESLDARNSAVAIT